MVIGGSPLGGAPIAGAGGPPAPVPISLGEATSAITFSASGAAYVETPAVTPPSNVVNIKRVSVTMPTPSLDANGKPDPDVWIPGYFREDWGRLRILVNGTDVTYFRNVVTQVPGWDDAEPFDDKTLQIHFPQITPMEPLPSWAVKWADVELRRVHPNGDQSTLWEGMWASLEDSADSAGSGFTMECIGANYQADLGVKTPTVNDGARDPAGSPSVAGTRDIGRLIADALASKPTRLLPMTSPPGAPAQTGIASSERGSFNGILTGFVQDLLSTAYNNPVLADGEEAVDIERDPSGSNNYWIVGTKGSVIPFGEAYYHGSMLGINLNEVASGIAPRPDGLGYWYSAYDGGVFTFNAQFYGSLGTLGSPNIIVEIEAMPDGAGYRIVDELGGVFCYGSAGFHGSLPGIPLIPSEPIVDFENTPSGNGYVLLGADGGTFAFGDAVNVGNGTTEGRTFVGIAMTSTGLGYWLLADTGEVYSYGDAVHHGNTPTPLNQPAADIARTADNGGYLIVAKDGGVFALGNAQYLGNGFDGLGTVHQWTLMKRPRRVPVLKVKDRYTVQWTVSVGAPGVEPRLSQDFSMAPNVGYGEGIGLDHGAWRNMKYPNNSQQGIPTMIDDYISIDHNNYSDDAFRWINEMHARGWGTDVNDGYTLDSASICKRLQKIAGLSVTGVVDQDTWDVTFEPGSDPDNLKNSYIAPLAISDEVEQYLYNANGSAIGTNPNYDPEVVRVERYENFGDGISKLQGSRWLQAEIAKDSVAPFVGTLVLKTDPAEGSRFDIRSGENIVLENHRGVDRRFHIVEKHVDFQSLTVSLTVDEKARDLMTVSAIIARDKSSVEPARRRTYRNKSSKQVVDDKAIFDSESGAGFIVRQEIQSETWLIKQIPCGEYGTMVGAEFYTDDASKFAAGVFDRPVYDYTMLGAGGSPFDAQYWDYFDEDSGLIIAWGAAGQAGGYWPALESDDPAPSLSGITKDNATWEFESTQPPYLWVAMWCEDDSFVNGQLFAAPQQ